MAKTNSKKTNKKQITMEEALWQSAESLRGSVETSEYKHVVLSLFFLKFASDRFEAQRKYIIEEYGEKYENEIDFYIQDNTFYLPPESRWSYIMEQSKQADIKAKLKVGLRMILDKYNYPPVPIDEIYKDIFEQAENFKKNRE